jgi:hypothetical protein
LTVLHDNPSPPTSKPSLPSKTENGIAENCNRWGMERDRFSCPWYRRTSGTYHGSVVHLVCRKTVQLVGLVGNRRDSPSSPQCWPCTVNSRPQFAVTTFALTTIALSPFST